VTSFSSAQTASIIDALADASFTLHDIANLHNTTLDALCKFLAQPETRRRIEDFEAGMARRARVAATGCLPTAVVALSNMIAGSLSDQAHTNFDPSDRAAIEYRRRADETTRRAAKLLLSIAKFHPDVLRIASPKLSRAVVGRLARNFPGTPLARLRTVEGATADPPVGPAP
jgi:hypothetical protein